ncbi:hypothetical protein SLS64_013250 [Diaporthe eres]|uniref:Uncharacterized protein n=1 Tax=Diaporthe eres TaxID=83184 RepID=A0ABR1P1F0_DIAER
MEPKKDRIIVDANDEKDPSRVAEDARWKARNAGLWQSRWSDGDDLEWSLETTRGKVFEEIKVLARVKTLSPHKMALEERNARSKVYEDMVWARNVRDDMADLESEEARERLFDAVSKELASSRGQDDEARACGIVDWAGSDTEKLDGGYRSRAYLAIEAMCKYCESVTGEEKLGIIAQKMRPDQMHVAPSLLKKRAARASKGN